MKTGVSGGILVMPLAEIADSVDLMTWLFRSGCSQSFISARIVTILRQALRL
jgi:hypothetical protein